MIDGRFVASTPVSDGWRVAFPTAGGGVRELRAVRWVRLDMDGFEVTVAAYEDDSVVSWAYRDRAGMPMLAVLEPGQVADEVALADARRVAVAAAS